MYPEIAAPKLSAKTRENILQKNRDKFARTDLSRESEAKIKNVLPPLFCVSCAAATVPIKNQVCDGCAQKLANRRREIQPHKSPFIILITLIVVGFITYQGGAWLFKFLR